jgi:hypothetical protein
MWPPGDEFVTPMIPLVPDIYKFCTVTQHSLIFWDLSALWRCAKIVFKAPTQDNISKKRKRVINFFLS